MEFVIKSYSERSYVICILFVKYCTTSKYIITMIDIFVASVIYIFLSFVKLQVKVANYDGMSKYSAVISNFCISQGSVATQLR